MPDSIMVPAQFSFAIRNSDLKNGSDSQILKLHHGSHLTGKSATLWKLPTLLSESFGSQWCSVTCFYLHHEKPPQWFITKGLGKGVSVNIQIHEQKLYCQYMSILKTKPLFPKLKLIWIRNKSKIVFYI